MRGPLALLRCRRGIAATEFALILPLMILVLAGTAELGNALLVDRKVTRASHMAADLVAQTRQITQVELDDVFDSAREVMRPFPETLSITISSVYFDPENNRVRVVWSRARNAEPRVADSDYLLPEADMLLPGESVIVAEIAYPYESLFADLIIGSMTLSDVSFLKPRRSTQVALM